MEPSKTSTTSKSVISPREAAAALGVSESSVKRWCDLGRLEVVKTPGGHRRVPVQSLLRFAREGGHALRDSRAIGGSDVPRGRGLRGARAALLGALLADDEHRVHAVLDAEWHAGRALDGLCDTLIAPTLADLGERWTLGKLAIYQERRACELLQRALLRLGDTLAPRTAARERSLALGGSLEGDPYELPTLMAELVLRERGFDARSLGTGLPAETLARAIVERRPRLVWLAAAVTTDEERLGHDVARLADVARAAGAAVVVGGRALHRSLRQQLRYSAFCDTMGHLATFADALGAARST